MQSKIGWVFVLLACGLLPLPSEAQTPAARDIAGFWQGSLSISGISLRLVVKITRKPDKTLTATLDSPDQSAKDIPVSTISFEQETLKIELAIVGASFEGKRNAAGTEIAGTFRQAGQNFPLTLKRVDKPVEVRRPQEPKPPFPYLAEDLTYPNTAANIFLGATLTLPKTGGPHPAIILISGSGPQNRDEELLGHKPFLVIADYLTRRGIAVLRVDDRGIGKSTGTMVTATSRDFAGDVKAGIAYLKTRKEIDPKRIGLAGHSEGGLIAPMVAAEMPEVAFIVLLAGPGVPGIDIIKEQSSLIAKVGGASDQATAINRELLDKSYQVLQEESDNARASTRLLEVWEKIKAKLTPDEQKSIAGGEDGIKAQLRTMTLPWFRFFLSYDPRGDLKRVKCPVLALNGELDLQVPPKQSLPEIEKALQAGGNTHYQLKALPSLNHLFQTCKTGSPAEYSQIEETFAPAALKILGDWIAQQVGVGR